jgi:GntR family transcriptional regulator
MLHFQINPHSGVPVYRQIVDQVKHYVASGSLRPGDQLPSIRELAKGLVINPSTVVRVYADLEHEGVIEMQHGKGAFVAACGQRLSADEREAKVRSLARHLAVETTQIGAPASQVLKAVREELAKLEGADDAEAAAKVAMLPKR